MLSEEVRSLSRAGCGRPLLAVTTAVRFANPEGGGHGCPPFFDRAWMASRKIPERMTGRVRFVGEAVSFGYFSLLASSMLALRAGCAVRTACVGQQRKVTRSPAGERKLCFCTSSEDQTLSSADAAEFISFGRPQKKRNQRKTSPRRSTSGESFIPGFFDSPSMARSKNAAHPWAAPYGSAVCIDHSLKSQRQSKSQSQSQNELEHAPYRRHPKWAEERKQ